MSLFPLFLKHLVRFNGSLETSGESIETESGTVVLPQKTSVVATVSGGQIVVDLSNPVKAAKRFLGLKFTTAINPFFIGEEAVQASIGGMRVMLYAVPDEPLVAGATPRSPHWDSVRDSHLRQYPTCEACGGDEFINVHHVVPFSVDQTKELVPSNLITLCQHPARPCHYYLGHLGRSWQAWNPDVRSDAARHLEAIRKWESQA